MEEAKPLSLDLAFSWVREVLKDQEKNAEVYNNRMVLLFSASTAILGIGFPLGYTEISKTFSATWTISTWLAATSIVSYLLCAIIYAVGTWPRKFIKLDDPATIREEFWNLEEEEFKIQILAHTEEAHKENRSQLNWKARAIYGLTVLLPIETISLVLAFALTLR